MGIRFNSGQQSRDRGRGRAADPRDENFLINAAWWITHGNSSFRWSTLGCSRWNDLPIAHILLADKNRLIKDIRLTKQVINYVSTWKIFLTSVNLMIQCCYAGKALAFLLQCIWYHRNKLLFRKPPDQRCLVIPLLVGCVFRRKNLYLSRY